MRFYRALSVLAISPGVALAQDRPPRAACAAEARYVTPDDATGKSWERLDPAVAIPLCEAALRADGSDQESRANLARALTKAERREEALPLFRIAADAGNPQAIRQLALLHEKGEGVPQDPEIAFRLMKQAAEAGYTPALSSLAKYLEDGTGTAKDEAAAITWYRKALVRGDAVAAVELGLMLEEGRGAPPDLAEANRLYRTAAEAGNADAMRYLAINHQNGIGLQKNFAEAVRWYRKATEAGDLESYNRLGLAYELAEDPHYDINEANRWYRLGSEAGDHRSTTYLAVNYNQGLGLPIDRKEAVRLYRLAADGGDSLAMRNLALAYLNGHGVERDYKQQVEWLQRAIDSEDTRSLVLLGYSYENGEGVARDDVEAVRLFRRAHEAGDEAGTRELGRMTHDGRGGLTQDYAAAVELLRAAADKGDATAMRHLASAYFAGEGVTANDEEARSWERRAAESGDPAAAFAFGKRLFEGSGPNGVNLSEARIWLKRAAELGEEEAEEVLVRAILADSGLGDRTAEGLRLLKESAGAGRGWAMAALAYPGPAIAGAAAVDEGGWRERLDAATQGEVLLSASDALKSGRLAEQRLGLALELARRSGGGDEFAARDREIALLIDLKLYGAALRRYETFVASDAFTTASPNLQQTFEQKFARQLESFPSSAFASADALLPLAERGVAGAAYALGLYYNSDANSEKDPGEARYWYSRAAELGSRSALLGLGYMQAEGLGGEKDEKTALNLFLRAADAGSAVAKRNLGHFYADGRGVPEDKAQAYLWFSRAADEGDLVANTSVALARFRGEGTAADPKAALDALFKGVDCLDVPAIYYMAQAYFEGAGVARSPEIAWRWMRFAASFEKESIGALGMARAAALGWGGQPDVKLAREWLRNARLRGDEVAARAASSCGEAPSLACLRALDGFVPKPLMKQPRTVAPPPIDAAAEEELLKSKFASAVEGDKPLVEVATAFGALDRHYRVNDDANGLLAAHLRWIILEEARFDRIYGSRDNYFALFDSSCRWGNASRAASAVGREEAAVLFAKVAVNRLQQARRRIADLDDDVRECFIEAHRDRYRELTGRFLELGRFEEAENVLAMLKDFEFQTYSGGDVSERGRSIDPMPMTAAQNEVLELYSAATRSFGEARQIRAEGANTSRAQLDRGVEQLVAALDDLDRHPQPQLIADTGRPPRVQAVLAGLKSQHIVALQAVVQPERIYWLLTTANEQKVISAAVKLPELTQMVRSYRTALSKAEPEAQTIGGELYKLIFAPVDVELRSLGAKQVLLSLDDMLRYVPFSALHDGEGWLVERYAFGVFRDTADLESTGKLGSDWDVAGFGATQAAAGLDALPLVGDELRGIVRPRGATTGLLPGTIHLDMRFDRGSLTEALRGDYEAIHIASHFVLDSKSRDASYLLLGTGERLSLEAFRTDGALKFEQADFLALSACETALSAKDASGVEIESMAEIAQGAGARAVLASLWRVADSSTAELMIGFYKGRSNGAVTKGEALRQAQLALIARGAAGEGPALAGVPAGEVVKFNHPFYWAPFILLGDSM